MWGRELQRRRRALRKIKPSQRIRARIAVALLAGAIVVTAGAYSGTSDALAQDRNQGRSMVISRNGIVATEAPLAAQAGVQLLSDGGNAAASADQANPLLGRVAPRSPCT